MVKQEWEVLSHFKRVLQPGQETAIRWNDRNMTYEPDVADTELQEYQRNWKGRVFMARIGGILGHDATQANNLANLAAGVDLRYKRISTIKYDAGASFNDISVDDNSGV